MRPVNAGFSCQFDGTNLEFTEQKIPDQGECFYDTLNLSRNEVLTILRSEAILKNPQKRKVPLEEMLAEFTIANSSKHNLPGQLRNDGRFNDLRGRYNKALADGNQNELERVINETKDLLSTEECFQAFVEGFVEKGWGGTLGNLNTNRACSFLDLIIEAKNWGVLIVTPQKNEESKLVVTHTYLPHANPASVVVILYRNSHYSPLIPKNPFLFNDKFNIVEPLLKISGQVLYGILAAVKPGLYDKSAALEAKLTDPAVLAKHQISVESLKDYSKSVLENIDRKLEQIRANINPQSPDVFFNLDGFVSLFNYLQYKNCYDSLKRLLESSDIKHPPQNFHTFINQLKENSRGLEQIEALTREISVNPTAALYCQRYQLLLNLGLLLAAFSDICQAIELEPNNLTYIHHRVRLAHHFIRNNMEQVPLLNLCYGDLKKIITSETADIQLLLMMVQVCHLLGRYGEALQYSDRIIAANSNSAQFFELRARIHFQINEEIHYNQAIKNWERAMTLDPNLTQACRHNIALAKDALQSLKALEDKDEMKIDGATPAEKWRLEFLENMKNKNDPDYEDKQVLVLSRFYEAGLYDECLKLCKRLEDYHFTDVVIFKANCLAKKGKFNAAVRVIKDQIAQLEAADEEPPDILDFMLAGFYFALKKYEKMCNYLFNARGYEHAQTFMESLIKEFKSLPDENARCIVYKGLREIYELLATSEFTPPPLLIKLNTFLEDQNKYNKQSSQLDDVAAVAMAASSTSFAKRQQLFRPINDKAAAPDADTEMKAGHNSGAAAMQTDQYTILKSLISQNPGVALQQITGADDLTPHQKNELFELCAVWAYNYGDEATAEEAGAFKVSLGM